MELINTRIRRLGRSPTVSIKSLCYIEVKVETKITSIIASVKNLKEGIRAKFGLVCSIDGHLPIKPIKLNYPGITQTFSTHESIFISWNKVENASYYELKLGDKVVVTEYNNYTFIGLNENTQYTIYIRALGDNIHYIDSDFTSVEVTTNKITPSIIKLDPPTIYKTQVTEDSIYIEWLKVLGASEYQIVLDKKYHYNTDITTYTFRNLIPDTLYNIQIKSIGDNINYIDSDYAEYNIETSSSPALEKLGSPTNIIWESTTESITLSWDKVENAKAYVIYGSNVGFNIVYDNTFTITNLNSNTEYIINLYAKGDHIQYEDSEEVQIVAKTQEPVVPPDEPELYYLEVYPKNIQWAFYGNPLFYEVKTNTNWTLSFNDIPYLNVLPKNNKWVSNKYNHLSYKVSTNLYWKLSNDIVTDNFIEVLPEEDQVIKENSTLDYKVASNTFWTLSYNSIDLWDNVKPKDEDFIIIDKYGEDLLVKIT